MSIKKLSNSELFSRVDVFDDSVGIIEGLDREADLIEDKTGEYAYYTREACVHIEGLWYVAKELKRRLELNDNQAK